VWKKRDICRVCYNSLDAFIVTISLHAFVEKSYYILITGT
jgi:hypothetical protein